MLERLNKWKKWFGHTPYQLAPPVVESEKPNEVWNPDKPKMRVPPGWELRKLKTEPPIVDLKPGPETRTLNIYYRGGDTIGTTYTGYNLKSSHYMYRHFLHWWFERSSDSFLLPTENNETGKQFQLVMRDQVKRFELKETRT